MKVDGLDVVGYQFRKMVYELTLPVDKLTLHVFRHLIAVYALIQGRTKSLVAPLGG